MNKKLCLLIAAAALVTAPVVHAETTTESAKTTIDKSDDGNYTAKTTTQRDQSNGTSTSKTDTVKMSTDSKGNTDKKVETDVTRDPPGLMNKSTAKTTDETVKNTDGTTKVVHKKTVDGKTVEDDKQETK